MRSACDVNPPPTVAYSCGASRLCEAATVSDMTDAERELYQAPFEAFVATRDRLVAALKATGDKAAASALAKRKRPSVSAWAVNQLWWHARADVDALFATAKRLRAGELASSGAHREALARLRARAATLLADDGHPPTEATLRRVAGTLAAIAAAGGFDPDPPGALVADRDPPGFEALSSTRSIAIWRSRRPTRTSRSSFASRAGHGGIDDSAAIERALRGVLGHGFSEHMKPSPLVKRLADQRRALERGDRELAKKLRYLIWFN